MLISEFTSERRKSAEKEDLTPPPERGVLMRGKTMLGHLYRYPHPTDSTKFLYVGQGNNRDLSHRRGTTAFGRKFKRDFPAIELPQPVRESVEVLDQLELNELETIWIFRFHTWRPMWGEGYNVVLPGSQDYKSLGAAGARTAKIKGIGLFALTHEQRSANGRKCLTYDQRAKIGQQSVSSGQLLAAAKLGGKKKTRAYHWPQDGGKRRT